MNLNEAIKKAMKGEELSHTRDWGTSTLTQQNKEATPGESTAKTEATQPKYKCPHCEWQEHCPDDDTARTRHQHYATNINACGYTGKLINADDKKQVKNEGAAKVVPTQVKDLKKGDRFYMGSGAAAHEREVLVTDTDDKDGEMIRLKTRVVYSHRGFPRLGDEYSQKYNPTTKLMRVVKEVKEATDIEAGKVYSWNGQDVKSIGGGTPTHVWVMPIGGGTKKLADKNELKSIDEAMDPEKKKKNLRISMDYLRKKIRDEQNFYKKQEYKDDLIRMQSQYDSLEEASGKSGLDVNHLAQKMGFKKPIPRTTNGQISYRFKGITRTQLSAALENNGYTQFDEFSFGDDIVTDHKKGDVIIRVGPADNGASAWFTITSDYKDYAAESDLYQNEAASDKEADIQDLQALIDDPDEAFAKKNYGSVEAYKKMLQSKIDRLQKNEAIQGATTVTLSDTDKLSLTKGQLFVNGKPFEMTDPDEALDWPVEINGDGDLVTHFRGRTSQTNTWKPSEISGYYPQDAVKKLQSDEEDEVSEEIIERHIYVASRITGESDRDVLVEFLSEYPINGREMDLLDIRNEYVRFKKTHQS